MASFVIVGHLEVVAVAQGSLSWPAAVAHRRHRWSGGAARLATIQTSVVARTRLVDVTADRGQPGGRLTHRTSMITTWWSSAERRSSCQTLPVYTLLQKTFTTTANSVIIITDHPRSGVVLYFRSCLSVCMHVCLSDDNYRKPWRSKFTFTHLVYLEGIGINLPKVKGTATKKVENSYSRGVKLWRTLSLFLVFYATAADRQQ